MLAVIIAFMVGKRRNATSGKFLTPIINWRYFIQVYFLTVEGFVSFDNKDNNIVSVNNPTYGCKEDTAAGPNMNANSQENNATTANQKTNVDSHKEIATGSKQETASGSNRETAAGSSRETATGSDRETAAGSSRETATGSDRETAAGSSKKTATGSNRKTATGSNGETATGSNRDSQMVPPAHLKKEAASSKKKVAAATMDEEIVLQQAVSGDHFNISTVTNECELREYVEKELGLVFHRGYAFYEFQHEFESISEDKELILHDMVSSKALKTENIIVNSLSLTNTGIPDLSWFV